MGEPGERRKSVSLDGDGGGGGGGGDEEMDFDRDPIPLKPKGKKPKFIKPADKHNANEGENVFLFFEVEGNPPPDYKFHKGFKDLDVEPRYERWTDGGGDHNHVILGIKECRSEEEGEYRCTITNEHGEADFTFNFYVTVEGGMDFRAMLMKRKRKEKKVVVKKIEFIEKPVDFSCQQGKCDLVTFTAKLNEKDKKGKWYIRNNDTYKDVRSTDYGLELHRDDPPDKYEWTADKDGGYKLNIKNPTVKEAGRYQLVVRIEKETYQCGAMLEVSDADPEYFFTEKFKKKKKLGYTNRPVKFLCTVNDENAKIRWCWNGKPISGADTRYEKAGPNAEGKCMLKIRKCTLEDCGHYSCEIMAYVKPGEDSEIECQLEVEEYPHKFTSKLKSQSTVEHQKVEFEVTVEAEDADVSWFIGGKKVNPDDKRFQVVVKDLVRKLVIKDTHLADAGEITAKTNVDSTSGKLRVAHANKFIKGLPSTVDVVEREALTFDVEVKDPEAPVDFYIAGEKVIPGQDERVQVRDLGNGHHQLIVNHVKMGDGGTIEARTPSNYGDGDEVVSSCAFNVAKGEEAPEIGDVPPVTGVAHKHCNWDVPYKVTGVQQSPLEVIVMKDGKELKIDKDVSLNIQGENVGLTVINPRREKSGTYKVILRNAQGQDERDIQVNIMDKPDPPESCTVTDVYYDNCVVHWTPPVDDGGTEITRYVVEALDNTTMSPWTPVAETTSGGERKIKCEGLAHRFRVRAVNKIGQGDPFEMLGDDILIKDPWDEPTKPGRPNILDWGPNHCDLSWEPPESDGGAPITHYEIEMFEKNMGRWTKGKTLSVQEVRMKNGLVHGTIDCLTEGSEYMFRIKAVNKGGPSEPSDPSDSMIAKIRFMKPFLHQPGMYDIEIKKGRTFRYDLWYGGEPPPTVIWERNGIVLQPDERTSMEIFAKKTVYCERNTVVTVVKADRAVDTGTYKIRLVCEGGTFEASGFVNVLDVPERPKNLKPDEVRAEHIKMSWQKPDDDGGSPITGYVLRMMDLEAGNWITIDETDANNLNYTVKGLRPGHLYQFEVCAINKEGISLPCKTRDPIRAENPYTPPSEPRDPKIVDFDHESVTLSWSPPINNGGRAISHYIIQKKDSFGGWFDALVTDNANCTATIEQLEARVPGLSLGKWYQFRVVAVNKAGESNPSIETKPHLCRYKNLAPSIDKGYSKTVKAHRPAIWQIKVKGEPPPTFKWFKDGQQIHHSPEYVVERKEFQGGAVAMLTISRTQMSDAGTYTLVAENKNGIDKVPMDLIVLDPMNDCECNMFKSVDLQCHCSLEFRYSEMSAEQVLMVDFGDQPPL